MGGGQRPTALVGNPEGDIGGDATSYEDRSFSTWRANVFAVLLVAPAVIVALWAFGEIHGWQALYQSLVDMSLITVVVVLVLGVVAHELLHVAAWRFAARLPKGSVRLGFTWKTLTPFAHCSVPMEARAYVIGAAAPGVILGIGPLAAGLLTGSGGVTAFGVLFTLAAGGDVLTIWVLRHVPPRRLVLDHPTRPGCLVEV